jgi:hypothetical protein
VKPTVDDSELVIVGLDNSALYRAWDEVGELLASSNFEGSLDVVLEGFTALKEFIESPLDFFELKSNSTPGTSDLRIVAQRSQRLIDLVSTLRALEVHDADAIRSQSVK